MTHEQLKALILEDFAKVVPLTKERAIQLVNARLSGFPKELRDFSEWFERNADTILQRVNA